MALADMIKDLDKKIVEAKTKIAGGVAFLKDAKKVAAAGLNDKKKMTGFLNNINLAFSRAKEVRDSMLQNKDYKAIKDAKDPLKVKFLKSNETLTKTVQAEFAALKAAAAKLEAAPKPAAKPKNVASLADWSAVMVDKVLGPKVLKFCKSSQNEEGIKFLSMMKQNKKDVKTYEGFVKAGSKMEINISSDLRKKFDAIAKAAKPDWGKAPWADATKEALRLFDTNIMPQVVKAA
jgi:hypothetical protein